MDCNKDIKDFASFIETKKYNMKIFYCDEYWHVFMRDDQEDLKLATGDKELAGALSKAIITVKENQR